MQITMTGDTESELFNSLRKMFFNGGSYSIACDGRLYTGCRIDSLKWDFNTFEFECVFTPGSQQSQIPDGSIPTGVITHKPKGKTEMNEWQFKSLHPRDIDFDDIAAGLSRKNPLALVKGKTFHTEMMERPKTDPNTGKPLFHKELVAEHLVEVADSMGNDVIEREYRKVPVLESYPVRVEDGSECYVVVHPYLWEKSLIAGIQMPAPFAHDHADSKTTNSCRVYEVLLSDFEAWMRWAREVKGASWEDEDRRRAEFTVTLPKV